MKRLLDLFCGAGGAAVGYHRAGFEVVGVDHLPQKNYPFEFHLADAMTYPLEGFDVIHASPPCQAYSSMKNMWNAKEHPDLLTPTRARLSAMGTLYVIENVRGAPIRGLFLLCGTQFGLGVDGAELRRHRYFEMEPPIAALIPPCAHNRQGRVIGVYGGHWRDRRRKTNTQDYSTEQRREAMGISWMNGAELSQAVPPAYTEYIGQRILKYIEWLNEENK